MDFPSFSPSSYWGTHHKNGTPSLGGIISLAKRPGSPRKKCPNHIDMPPFLGIVLAILHRQTRWHSHPSCHQWTFELVWTIFEPKICKTALRMNCMIKRSVAEIKKSCAIIAPPRKKCHVMGNMIVDQWNVQTNPYIRIASPHITANATCNSWVVRIP